MKPLALITGAGGGMGLCCAKAFGDSHTLILSDRDATLLEATSRALPGTALHTVVCDLSDKDSIAGLIDTVTSRGSIGAIVHTAGISPMMASWKEVVEVDLAGTARLMEGLLPLVGSGSVAVCIASIAAQLAPVPPELEAVLDEPLAVDLLDRITAVTGEEPNSGIAYAWAKRGVVRLCERLATPWGARGARIVSVSPGLIDTSMGRLELEENPAKDIFLERTPLIRKPAPGQSLPGRADDIASAVSFLCSDAASFISGCDLRVDGGLVAALHHG